MTSIEALWNEAMAHDGQPEARRDIRPDAPAADSLDGDTGSNTNMADLGAQVERAAQAAATAKAETAVDDAVSRIRSAAHLRPGEQGEPDINSPEYAFGEAFSNLVRHVVADYLRETMEPVIREAIAAEIQRASSALQKDKR